MTKGEYFKDKDEAIQFYKNNEPELQDKPEWLIEAMIDFSIQYPNYKEYCEVESKVKNGQALTAKQKKKYGHLQWDKQYTEYKKGDVLYDSVDIKEEGTYDDIARDPIAREKYNKYNLEFGEKMKPDENVKLRLKSKDNKEYEAIANVKDLERDIEEGNGMQKETWQFNEIKPIEK